ncbi:MAG TPA: N-acetyltransferase [Spirochaetota bacterium]|nr:N-acetyltransferase [Spirochaetota bacterium]
MNISIRNETENDYRQIEELTREAFWNLYVPGCNEHFLAHVMRNHKDFIASLDLVAILENRITGSIMYTKSHLVNESGEKIIVITFGPVSVLPEYQKKGIGFALIQHSIKKATADCYKAIVIQGHPYNYCKHGFKSSKDFNISDAEGRYPYSLLVLELEKGCLEGHTWKYYPSEVFNLNENDAEEFDKSFSHKKKEYRYSQEEFKIACRAYIE